MGNALDVALGALTMSPWQDLHVVNVWGNYMTLPSIYNELKYTLLLHGKVRMASGRNVERLEVVKVNDCRHMGNAKICVDKAGNYLGVIELYLGVEQGVLGENRSYLLRVIDPAPTAVQWKINGKIMHSTPLKDIDLNEINTLDITVMGE